MRKSIYLLTTTPTSHTHRFYPLPLDTPTSCSPHSLATSIHSTHSPQLSSILLTCAKFKVWMTIVENGWNVWVWLVGVVCRRRVCLVGVVVRRYIDFIILLIPTPLVYVIFAAASLHFVHLKKIFSFFYMYTDSKIIVSTRWGSLRLAPIIIITKEMQSINCESIRVMDSSFYRIAFKTFVS